MENLLTIVILTRNEAENLPKCFKHIPHKYKRIIIDSGSSDRTIEVAKENGCSIFINPWPGFAGQRNYAMEHCGINQGWVLFVDADEKFPPQFFQWFETGPLELEKIAVLMIPSFLFFCGKKLRYAPGYPIYHPRLVRSGLQPFTQGHAGHSETIKDWVRFGYGSISYDHFFFNGNIKKWMTKHVHLALLESKPSDIGGRVTARAKLSLFFGNSMLRIPARFFFHYFFRLGFLDGRAGFVYAFMYTWYEITKIIISIYRKHFGEPL